MKLSRAIAIAIIAGSFGVAAGVNAQSLRNVDTPNEFPPASYKGKQYVDSKGCVYIRAGIDGNVTWVPRMTRDRKVVCGYKPTNPGGTTSVQAPAKRDKNVVQIQAASPETQTAPKPVAAAAPKPTTRVVTKPKTTVRKVKPAAAAPVVVTPAKPKTKPAMAKTKPRRSLEQVPRQTGYDAPCRTGVVSKYKVRCGPQAELPYTPGTGKATAPAPVIRIHREGYLRGRVVREGDVGPHVRVVPRHVYEDRYHAMVNAEAPAGYRPVDFGDDRYNPYRAEQTFAGKAQMDGVWIDGTPRVLRRGTASEGYVSTRSSGSPVVSTRSESKEKALRLSGRAYVQVATYGDAATAQSVARKVRSLGVPVKIGKYTRSGVTKRMVLVGPFADDGAAESAAQKVRGAGYVGAFVRN